MEQSSPSSVDHDRHASPPGAAQHASPPPEPPRVLQDLLARADVQLNGSRPWDIQVHDKHMYERVFTSWSLGLGESYMDGEWDCDALDELFTRLLRADLGSAAMGIARVKLIAASSAPLFNLQSKSRAFEVGEQHYDAGNDVFEAMLDSRMIYSCAYWENAATLEEAQYAKLDMICRKLRLKPGETLLDIGCGWGGLAKFAAENYGVKVTGVTVSKEQLALAQQRVQGLPVELLLQDYRDLQGSFDKVVSVGMFEHVGPKNYDTYFTNVQRLMAPKASSCCTPSASPPPARAPIPGSTATCSPTAKLPSAVEISTAVEGRFIIEDWHNFGADYDRTLMAWWDRFQRAWPQLEARYGKRFYRMWQYYLMCCAGFFRSREGQLWQVILTHPQRGDTYRSLR